MQVGQFQKALNSMTSTKLIVCELLKDTASRENGAILRNQILLYLKTHDSLEIDLDHTRLTPSFADEAFGLLYHHLSLKEFHQRIKFVHLSHTHKMLLLHVLGNRFSADPSKDK